MKKSSLQMKIIKSGAIKIKERVHQVIGVRVAPLILHCRNHRLKVNNINRNPHH